MAGTGTPPREKARVYRTGRPDRLSPLLFAVDPGFFPRGCAGPCHGRPPFRLRFLNDTIVM